MKIFQREYNTMTLKYIRFLIVLCSLLCLVEVSIAAPQKNLWPRWEANNPESQQIIDHYLFQDFLSRYVITDKNGVNLVKYKNVTAHDRALLENYIIKLSQVLIAQYHRTEQLAFWINLYNALTIKIILDHYPVNSILDINISPGWFNKGPWDAKLITVENEKLSLNDIEHRIIRPIWNDPLTHYALNCASYSCPNLEKNPYTGNNLKMALNQAASSYINSARGVSVKNKQLTISKIYDWYQVDFGGNEQAVMMHLEQYASPKLKKQLLDFHKIDHYVYDWALNEP